MYSGPRWIFLVFALFGVAHAGGASFLLPIDGSVSGDLFPFRQTQLSIHWTGTVATSDAGERTVSLVLAGPGVKGRAESVVKPTDGSSTWRIEEAEVDLAQWFEVIAARFFPDESSFQAAGIMTVGGNGVIASPGYSGSLHFELSSAGSLAEAGGAWSVHGLAGRLECPDFPAWTTRVPQRLIFSELKVGETSLKNGVVDYQIESAGRIRVLGIRGEVLGATFTCSEFVIDSTNAPIETSVRLQKVDLAALQAYLPKAVAEAQGAIDAELQLRWSAESGLELGHGTLRLRPGENVSIRLAPSPGFLSSQVPARIDLAPAWMGRLGRAFSQVFPAHQTLQAIENGEQSLIVESINGQIDPEEEGKEATAVLHIVAHPTKTDAVKKVRLNVKVVGPLSDVLRYGMDQHLSFSR